MICVYKRSYNNLCAIRNVWNCGDQKCLFCTESALILACSFCVLYAYVHMYMPILVF